MNKTWLWLGGGLMGLALLKREAIVGVVSTVIGYVNGKPTALELIAIGGTDKSGQPFRLRKDAAGSFVAMKAAAAADGIALLVSTAFRDMAFQEKLYAMYLAGTGSLAAKPGFSNHQGGIALDLETANGTNKAYFWLTNNAAKFGWKRTVSSEPWHWEYLPTVLKVA